MMNQHRMSVCVSAGLLALLVGCNSSGTNSVPPPTAPPLPMGCDAGDVVFDTGGTNGYGRQTAVNNGQVTTPTDLAFVPGSNAFVVVEQAGFAAYFNGACDAVNRIDLRSVVGIVSGGEQGLLNIEFHPDYASNDYVFLYHTSVASTVNSITRMTVSFGTGGILVLSDAQRIIDFRKAASAAASNHNGGGMVFAPDKTLLASVGDGGADSSTAQADTRLIGKVIRILPNLTAGVGGYSIPSGNMFLSTNTACSNVAISINACPEILAKGLRNPFRMSRDGNLIYLGDVGAGTEEINSFNYTNNTANFGWPTYDGFEPSPSLPGYRNPIVYYTRNGTTGTNFRSEDPMGRASGWASVIIGDVYRGSQYDAALNGGALLFGEFYDGYIRAVGVDSSGNITDTDGTPGFHLVHAEAISSMVQGPDGYLYFTRLFGPATVYRLVRP